MAPLGCGKKRQPQLVTIDITDKEDQGETIEIDGMLNPDEQVLVITRHDQDSN